MRLLLAAALLTSSLSSAQITLNNSDFADGGDTVRMSSATDPAIDFVSTGSNSTWNFSGLIAESQVLKNYNDLSNASTFMQFLFGGFAPPSYQATNVVASDALPIDQVGPFLPVNISEVNSVSRNTVDSITSIGISIVVDGTEIPFKSDTIETRYKFPANYGDVYSSRGYSKVDLNPIFDAIWIQYRQRNSNIDGWGSITTPFGTFDALRMRHSIQEQDSIYLGQFGQWVELPIPPSTIYEWWATGELEPILRITTSDFGGAENVTDIEFRDSYDPLIAGINELITEVRVYPNPAQDELTLDGLEVGSSFVILSSDGKIVQTGNVLTASQIISLDEMTPGSYTLFVRNTDGTYAKSAFIKQ
jgi:hypothetical protein